MSPVLPNDVIVRRRVRIRITEPLISAFANLTGDRSSLHVSDAFARRSAYRQPVVHGMLPVAFLPLLAPVRVGGYRAVPTAIAGRFVSPVYVGDIVVVTVDSQPDEGEAASASFDYRIEHAASNRLLTRGSLTVRYEQRTIEEHGSSTADDSLLVSPLTLNNFRLEDIEPGLKDSLEFSVNPATVQAFLSLLREGLEEQEQFDPTGVEAGFHLPNLLSILLFSTSVGVSLPGASATFLEFSAHVEKTVELGQLYRLDAKVSHRSRATRIVKKEMLVHSAGAADDVNVRGKVAVLVNEPFTNMPTVQELRHAALDPGLKDKVVIVTGASRGIGETTAKLFALFGARVVVNYHRGSDDAARVVREIADAGGEAFAVAADVANPDQVAALVSRAVERYGGIDVLVNNAARDYRPVPFLQLTWQDVQNDIDVIAKGAFLCCQHVIPSMLERGSGKIVNISSVATDNPPPDQTKYVMAKSALVGLTRSLSIEFASRNIQVNLVVPNFVETDFVAHIQDGFRRKIAQDTPMRRHASPVDVARAVVMLASSYSSFTTGQKIMVTGGGAPYV